MPEVADDHTLIRAYLQGSQQAFTDLALRHTPLVYSAALRQTHNPDVAQDVTQAVFILLSQKAATFSGRVVLSAWLYRAARFAAKDAMKKQHRRQHHEAIAAVSPTAAVEDDPWSSLAPILDDAMDHLRDRDRTAVLLRYFENKSLSDVGALLGVTEAAAGQRITRAIERLRNFFSRRGVDIPSIALVSSLTAHAVIPPPANAMAAAISATSAPTTAIAKGAAAMMFWSNAKFAVAAVMILAIVLPPLILESHAQSPIPVPANPPQITGLSVARSQPLHVDLPGGAIIEIPCLAGSGDASGKIWSPNGTLLDPSSLQFAVDPKMLAGIHLEPDQHIVLFPVRFKQGGAATDTFFMSAGNNGGVVGKVLHDNKPAKDTWVWAETFDRTQTTASAHLRMELNPWQLLATWDSHADNTDMTTDDPHFRVQPSMPALRNGELFVPITIAYHDLDWDDRLFAVLKDGTRRQAESRGYHHRIAALNVETWSFSTDKPINPEDVVRYEFELTPLTEVTIADISLVPGHPTRPTVKITPPAAPFVVKPTVDAPGGL